MTVPVFVDTNVLVYAVDASEGGKQELARAWLEHLWRTRAGRLSIQVLQEFYVTVTRKLSPGMEVRRARHQVRRYLTWHPIVTDAQVFEGAWEAETQFGLAWWDALVVASARRQECAYLLSEDFSDGAKMEGVVVVDPFRHPPSGILRD